MTEPAVKIFMDEERGIRVEPVEGGVRLYLYEISDIFPALHYFESHPEARAGEIVVTSCLKKVTPLEGDDVERFIPELTADDRGHAHGYGNYNFVLLNSYMKHSVWNVVSEFAAFLSESKRTGKRKVRIKDVEPSLFPGLLKSIKMKKESGKGEFYYRVSSEESAIFLYAERFSKGLRNRLGIYGDTHRKFPDSPLDKRLYF